MKLTLQAYSNNWELFSTRKKNQSFLTVRKEILRRDQLRCQFCQFSSDTLEIINIDNNYEHNTKANLTTACELCAKCTLLDYYALDYEGKDKIIYLPELSQEKLNYLCRLLFCQDDANSEIGYNAKMLYAKLQDRAEQLNEKTQSNLSHPAMFCHYQHSKQKDNQLISRLRWLPAADSYQDCIKSWQASLPHLENRTSIQ